MKNHLKNEAESGAYIPKLEALKPSNVFPKAPKLWVPESKLVDFRARLTGIYAVPRPLGGSKN